MARTPPGDLITSYTTSTWSAPWSSAPWSSAPRSSARVYVHLTACAGTTARTLGIGSRRLAHRLLLLFLRSASLPVAAFAASASRITGCSNAAAHPAG